MSSKAKLTVIGNPLEPSRITRDAREIDVLRPLSDVLPSEVVSDPDNWAVIDSGKVVETIDWKDYVVLPGTEITCSPRISGKNGMSFLFGSLLAAGGFMLGIPYLSPILISMGIGMALQGVIGLFTHAPSSSSDDSRPTYGFGQLTNDIRPGAPIPVVYGDIVVGGLIAARAIQLGKSNVNFEDLGPTYVAFVQSEKADADSNNEYLDQAIVISEGPIDVYGSNSLYCLEVNSVDMPPPLSRLQRYEFDDLLTVTGDLDRLLRDLHGITSRMLCRHV